MPSSSTSSSSSHSSLSDWNLDRRVYDVFLCFRGETRYTFTSHLYAALCQKKINAFMDDMLDRGKELPTLLRRIEESAISIIIFSENFASSSWCLDEVVKIVECMSATGQTVLPVFYYVDPSDVTEEMGSYSLAIAQLEEIDSKKPKTDDEMVMLDKGAKWKGALKIVAAQAGWDSKVIRPDSRLVEEIVKEVGKILNGMSRSTVLKKFVGLDARIWELEQLLCFVLDDVRFLGIWGMGGIGKTTTAKALYKEVSGRFEVCNFVESVTDKLRRYGLEAVKDELYSKLLNEKKSGVDSFDLDNSFNRARLRRSKILIFLDDVEDTLQLQELLLEGRDSFGPGSRIIVTSRNLQVLKNVVDAIYEVKGLSYSESLQLFSLYAFNQNYPPQDRMKQSKLVVNYCKRNPLALKVMGAALFDKSIEEWDSAMEGLGKFSNPEIQNVLRLSYDRLTVEEQQLFLDIVCFFRWEKKEHVTNILDGCYSSVKFKISLLINKGLITVSNDKLEVHDLIQEMGWSIVNEGIKPENRSRLWDPEDVHHVLTRKKGTEAIEAISLDTSKVREMNLEPDVFAPMDHLRLLNFYVPPFVVNCKDKVKLSGGLKMLSEELRYFHWYNFPSKSFPFNFHAENLVELSLPYSKVKQLWTGAQHLVKLKRIDLKYSKHLKKLPNISEARNIESINLEGCRNIVDLPSSIEHLDRLEYLNLRFCENLKTLPCRIDSRVLSFFDLSYCSNVTKCPEIAGNLEVLNLSWTAVKEIPHTIHELKVLRRVCLTGCPNITRFPQIPTNIRRMHINDTAIKEVPASIELLTALVTLDLSFNKNLSELPNSMWKLKSLGYLLLCRCTSLDSIPEILEPMESLVWLNLQECKNLRRLPSSICNLKSLKHLNLSEAGVKELPSSIGHLNKLEELKLDGCKRLSYLPSSIHNLRELQDLTVSRIEGLQLHPLIGLSSLASIALRSCYSLEIPHDLGSLVCLRSLDLSESTFESLPASIQQLSQLCKIDLTYCKKLHALPNLPGSLEVLKANNCKALNTLSSVCEGNLNFLSFINCSKLSKLALGKILGSIQSTIHLILSKIHSARGQVKLLFPANEVPQWFYYQSLGSMIIIRSPSNWLHFKGIVFCVVLAPEAPSRNSKPIFPSNCQISCECRIKTNDCEKDDITIIWSCYVDDIHLLMSNHVLLWYDPRRIAIQGGAVMAESWLYKYCGSEASFVFRCSDALHFGVKKCGIFLT